MKSSNRARAQLKWIPTYSNIFQHIPAYSNIFQLCVCLECISIYIWYNFDTIHIDHRCNTAKPPAVGSPHAPGVSARRCRTFQSSWGRHRCLPWSAKISWAKPQRYVNTSQIFRTRHGLQYITRVIIIYVIYIYIYYLHIYILFIEMMIVIRCMQSE